MLVSKTAQGWYYAALLSEAMNVLLKLADCSIKQ